MKPKLGYWFGDSILPNGDGRRILKGATLKVRPPLELCRHGLHYSSHPMDALQYADTSTLWLVEDVGETLTGEDKCCTTARKHLIKIDADPILREFARWCSLRVVHLWNAPEVVILYLKTGDESIRAAAWAAAMDTAMDAAGVAAWGAAGVAAWGAAWSARAAARDAARDAAWVAARVAARDAAWVAARVAARADQRKKLKRMIDGAFKKEMGDAYPNKH